MHGVRFEYQGKSGQQREVTVEETGLSRHICEAAELPGYEIFRYQTGYRSWENVDSEDVNAFIRQQIGDDFSIKDLRTCTASRLAAAYWPEARARKKNTPAESSPVSCSGSSRKNWATPLLHAVPTTCTRRCWRPWKITVGHYQPTHRNLRPRTPIHGQNGCCWILSDYFFRSGHTLV